MLLRKRPWQAGSRKAQNGSSRNHLCAVVGTAHPALSCLAQSSSGRLTTALHATPPSPTASTSTPEAAAAPHTDKLDAQSAAESINQSYLEDYTHPVSIEDFRKMGYQMVDMICDYYSKLGSVPVRPDVQPGYLRAQLPAHAPEQPESFEAVMRDVNDTIMPGVVHWQSPNFFAWFSANSSFPGLLAEMLMAATNMIGFSWAASPVSTELEMAMMDWLAELCGLPQQFMCNGGAGPGGGAIQGTSSEAVLVALLAARARAMRGRPAADRLKLVAYASDQTHSCFRKATMVAGIDHVRVLPATPATHYALAPEALRQAMAADAAAGLLPCFVCATIGTTSSCAVDPVGELAEVARGYGAWTHVDAAYAGAAALLPEQRHHFAGLVVGDSNGGGGSGGSSSSSSASAVDSYSFNPHKWMLTNFDCCALWVSDSGPLKEALSLTPVFLQGTGNALDYKDWQIPLGRRFRSLKLYFVLRMYGAERLRAFLRHHIALAGRFADMAERDARFEVVRPQRFGLVCFRLRGVPNSVNQALLDALNGPPSALYLSHTELQGRLTLRLAIGASGTQRVHVDAAWARVQECAGRVLAQHAAAAAAAAAAAGGDAVQ